MAFPLCTNPYDLTFLKGIVFQNLSIGCLVVLLFSRISALFGQYVYDLTYLVFPICLEAKFQSEVLDKGTPPS